MTSFALYDIISGQNLEYLFFHKNMTVSFLKIEKHIFFVVVVTEAQLENGTQHIFVSISYLFKKENNGGF